MSFLDLVTAHPYGTYSERYGCYYTLDYDSELGYFRKMKDGSFENTWNFVDFDTLDKKTRKELERIAAYISKTM